MVLAHADGNVARQAVQQCILGLKDILCIVQNSLSLLGVGS